MKLIAIFCLSFVVLTSGGCGRNTETTQKLNLADSVMETDPDSALRIIGGIDSSSLRGDKEAARYALLKSVALDKNYIDTATFDIINPAVEYYEKHGTPDEKFRTYYYSGRIYQNQGNDDSAMKQWMKAMDLKDEISDSLLLARNLVALGSLYYKQYKVDKFIENNLHAAKLYRGVGKDFNEMMSYANALDGYIIKNDKTAADSIYAICRSLTEESPEGRNFILPYSISYFTEFGSKDDLRKLLEDCRNEELSQTALINIALAYSRLGEHEIATDIISGMDVEGSILDSLKYNAVKTEIFENQNDYDRALSQYKIYSEMHERYEKDLLSQDILFADEKHRLEVANLQKVRSRDRVILGAIIGVFALLLVLSRLYYSYSRSRSKEIIAEKENENLKIAREALSKEKERLQLEKEKEILIAENLRKDKERLEAEQRQHELEAANLLLEKKQLEEERDHLKNLLEGKSELSRPLQEVIMMRLDMLNSLLAKEISNNERHAKPYNKWIESIRRDKDKFMESTRVALAASHPRLIAYFESRGLTVDEINYLCLYAIGLRGNEIGEYIRMKRHYSFSSEIRKKLGIDGHDTNLGTFVRKKMNEL